MPAGILRAGRPTKGDQAASDFDGSPKLISTSSGVALPQTTQTAYFTVTNFCKIISIVGVVTTVIQAQANNTKLVMNPTGLADVDLCAVNDINADAAGTLYSITGTLANAMVANTNVTHEAQAGEVVVAAGTIDLNCAASNTGATQWHLTYVPLCPGATITAAV